MTSTTGTAAGPITSSSEPPPDDAVAEVGGKAAALLRMTRAGLPVPAFFVLGVSFFEPWLEQVSATPQWCRLREALDGDGDLGAASDAVAAACADLRLDAARRERLDAAVDALRAGDEPPVVAVRSSSPEEDLSGASFAGGYTTVLGVLPDAVADAARACFASAFDERVMVYKRRQGFATDDPRIAVVVQRQVDADVAGVAFSLDPSTNDLDHVVVDANHGLGESVVSGLVSPDHHVVDAVSGEVVTRVVGAKEVSVWLRPDGGTTSREEPRSEQPCLTDEQLHRVVAMVKRVERWYDHPVDVEWAIADDDLHLLQARPITAHVPLVPQMRSAPGERRTLYMDAALTEGVTTNQPMTPLTLDWLFRSMEVIAAPMIGPVRLPADGDPRSSVIFATGGRYYVNMSLALSLFPAATFARQMGQVDALLGALFGAVDRERYRASSTLRAMRWTTRVPQLARGLWAVRHAAAATVRAMAAPRRFQREYDRVVGEVDAGLRAPVGDDEGLGDLLHRHAALMGRAWAEASIPALVAYFVPNGRLGKVVAGDARAEELLDVARTGLPGNVAVQIGVRLHELSRLLPRGADGSVETDVDVLVGRVSRREMPEDFLAAWDGFVIGHGARGPGELMLSRERYGEDPRLALEQMVGMVGGAVDPSARQREHAAAAKEAYGELLDRLHGRDRRRFRSSYALVARWAGTRDTPKQQMVLGSAAFRTRALAVGAGLVSDGRLDEPEDVLMLTLDEIEAGQADTTVDLRALREQRTGFYDQLARVPAFPHLIDSRGRIGQLPPREGDDDPHLLTGLGVSRGTRVGTVKVLATPREKPVRPGDVLVAYTTDPGWTPLFAAAEAVVLEVGGVLQHGGVVAREYGVPCVAGIQGVTARLRDGQRVEVDGAAGTVRILDEGDSAGG